MMPNEPMRLEHDDLFSPKVEAYLEEQAVLRRPVPEFKPRPLLIRILFSSYFYLSIASALGGFCAWAMLEPFVDENDIAKGSSAAAFLLFPTVGGMIGLFLGAAEGLMARNLSRAALCGVVGLGIGFGGGLVALFAGGFVFLDFHRDCRGLAKRAIEKWHAVRSGVAGFHDGPGHGVGDCFHPGWVGPGHRFALPQNYSQRPGGRIAGGPGRGPCVRPH